MEDWIESIKMKLLAEQPELPPGDWERFEADYLASRVKRRVLPWAFTSVSAAAAVAAAVLLLNKPATPEAPRIESASVPALTAEADNPIIVVEGDTPTRPVRLAAVPRRIKPVSQEENVPSTVAATATTIDPEPEPTKTESKASTQEHVQKSSVNTLDIKLFDQLENQERPNRKLLAFAPYVKGFHGGKNDHEDFLGANLPEHIEYSANPGSGTGMSTFSSSDHQVPLSLGLDVSFALFPRLGLTSGLDLTLYRSNYVTQAGAQSIVQKAYYLGIPLRLDWTFWDQGRFSAWLGAGGKADYLVYGRLENLHLKDNTIHWSVAGDIGIQYRLLPSVGVFLQPEISYYFKPSEPTIKTYRTEHPLTLSLGAGLRFSF